MNMFKQVKADSVESYIDSVPEDRKEDILFLHNFIQKAAPDLKPYIAYNMLGYGSFPYKIRRSLKVATNSSNYKKEDIEWPVISLANQKNYISVYICSIYDGKYLAETYTKSLGKVSVGKSCIRFKKLDDINLDVLKEVIQKAAKKPGLVGLGTKQ